jgi:hypothetical protein
MPLLTELENFFVLFLQRCYAYGVKGSDTIVLELASERSLFRRVIYAAGQPRSGDIPVENRAQQNLQPRQVDIFRTQKPRWVFPSVPTIMLPGSPVGAKSL